MGVRIYVDNIHFERVTPVKQWQDDASCAGADPDAFFPDGRPDPFVRKVCFGCPVRIDCLEDAMKDERTSGARRYGFRGGLSGVERRKLQAVIDGTPFNEGEEDEHEED